MNLLFKVIYKRLTFSGNKRMSQSEKQMLDDVN